MNTHSLIKIFARILVNLGVVFSLTGLWLPGDVSRAIASAPKDIARFDQSDLAIAPGHKTAVEIAVKAENEPIHRSNAAVGLSLDRYVENIDLSVATKNRHRSIDLEPFKQLDVGTSTPVVEAGSPITSSDQVEPGMAQTFGVKTNPRKASPFVGSWQAIDVDGSEMVLAIAGPPNGPFQITWTDNYISFCGGEAGIVRGTGALNPDDPGLLEADLLLTCFTSGDTLALELTFRYHPEEDTLSVWYAFGIATVWSRHGMQPLPPQMDLRVNYGNDWVESFYQEGHSVWVAVTESDGVTVKAAAEVFTEPKDFWGGETGFQTNPEDWTPNQPDIQPYDWVYAWVDNGARAQVQIGDIFGVIDLVDDSIEGTILASWFTDPVQVECLDWGSGGDQPFNNADGGFIITNGGDPYSCAWEGWDIQPGQTIGVGYLGPDGHWVANAFFVPSLTLRVNYGHDWVESFYEAGHTARITVTESDGVTVKATAALVTEPKEYWGGEPGFQTLDSVWLDPDENPMDSPPDIQPYDWVYGSIDNGASAQVQLGDINGEVRFDLDNIKGTVVTSWITEWVQVECLDWGSGGDPINKEGGFILTNGVETYSCNWDPETEWDVQPWQDIGVGYSTPDGHWVANAFRDERWMAVWTYDPPPGSLQVREHSYYFDLAYTVPEEVDYPPMDPRTFTVSGDTPLYGGHALLGPWDYMPIQVWNGSGCEVVSALNPDQPIRFILGWVNDYSMTYEEAFAHFSSLTVNLTWDGEAVDSTSFTMSELLPFTGRDDRIEYICTFTADIILVANQPDWVDSGITVSAGQSFTIEAFGFMNPCSDTYPNGADYCIFYTPQGAEGVVPYENEFGIFPGPGLRFMALLGKIGGGEPFYVGAGGTFTAAESGTLWLTPNDNLRTDNQGAYTVLVRLEP